MIDMARILTGDNVTFPAGPGLLTLPNSAVVTCPGKYTVNAKGKHRFMPYTGDAVSFTVASRPKDTAKVTTHELGEAPATELEGGVDQADDQAAAGGDVDEQGDDKKGAGD